MGKPLLHTQFIGMVLAGALALGGYALTKEEAGTVTDTVAGGVLGSTNGDGSGQIAATFAGAVPGALVGQEIGRSLDRIDEMHAQHVLESNRVGETAHWDNPDKGT
jgi:outer membrane lipoprotein SlyB